MTEKTYTSEEINEKTNEYFMSYVDLFRNDKMDFTEYIMIKSVVCDIQMLFDEINQDDGDVE